MWKVGNIRDIAESDASSIGINLYEHLLQDGEDTAISVNAGWSGTIGFNLLGGFVPYESWRLYRAGDRDKIDTLDDVKNVLYAIYSYGAGDSRRQENKAQDVDTLIGNHGTDFIHGLANAKSSSNTIKNKEMISVLAA